MKRNQPTTGMFRHIPSVMVEEVLVYPCMLCIDTTMSHLAFRSCDFSYVPYRCVWYSTIIFLQIWIHFIQLLYIRYISLASILCGVPRKDQHMTTPPIVTKLSNFLSWNCLWITSNLTVCHTSLMYGAPDGTWVKIWGHKTFFFSCSPDSTKLFLVHT